VPLSGHGSSPTESVESPIRARHLARIAPGLSDLLGYRFSDDFRHDAMAGLSVAAVALPVSIAYAQLAGFDPVVGLYSSILPLVAYAIFGTSRQLMVNPDAAAFISPWGHHLGLGQRETAARSRAQTRAVVDGKTTDLCSGFRFAFEFCRTAVDTPRQSPRETAP
jgi:hypothetical protein